MRGYLRRPTGKGGNAFLHHAGYCDAGIGRGCVEVERARFAPFPHQPVPVQHGHAMGGGGGGGGVAIGGQVDQPGDARRIQHVHQDHVSLCRCNGGDAAIQRRGEAVDIDMAPGLEPGDRGVRSAFDVVPTIVELLGARPPARMSGKSLL